MTSFNMKCDVKISVNQISYITKKTKSVVIIFKDNLFNNKDQVNITFVYLRDYNLVFL